MNCIAALIIGSVVSNPADVFYAAPETMSNSNTDFFSSFYFSLNLFCFFFFWDVCQRSQGKQWQIKRWFQNLKEPPVPFSEPRWWFQELQVWHLTVGFQKCQTFTVTSSITHGLPDFFQLKSHWSMRNTVALSPAFLEVLLTSVHIYFVRKSSKRNTDITQKAYTEETS